MTLQELRNQLPEFAKDTRLNLGSVLSEEGAPGLSQKQIYGIALASAYATRNLTLIETLLQESTQILEDQEIDAAKATAVIMAMNNVYYRFLHLAADPELEKLPAKLRMNRLANPGIDRTDFELYSLAVSAINACGSCIQAHAAMISKAGLPREAIQSTARIAAVIMSTAQAVEIGK